jgi:hypothetical protein
MVSGGKDIISQQFVRKNLQKLNLFRLLIVNPNRR